MSAGKWDPELYDAKHGFVAASAKDLLAQLVPQPGERILDLGCGTGTLTSQISASGADVLGVDRSAEMIDQARKKFPQVRFEVCDARSLPFSSEFDAVFSNAVLHWIPEAWSVVEGISRGLKLNGRFVAEFGGKGNVGTVVASLESALTSLGISPAGANPWYYPGLTEYASLLERHGLEVYEAALFERPTRLEDGERGFENWIKMFCQSFLERVPEHRHQTFLRSAEQSARAQLWKGDHWALDYRRLRIAARKASHSPLK